MAAGVGGLLGNMLNPGLDDRIASELTPNANPLAQQASQGNPATGAPGSPQVQQQNLPNPAVTNQDPVTGNLIADLMKRKRVDEASQSFNEGLSGIAAGFGTAQQQHDKQAALGNAGGGSNTIGSIGDMLGIQKEVTNQNEHARFMAGMGTLAQVLFPGDPDGVAKATEVANNSGLLGQFGGAAASNATTTPDVKNADAATREWANANPKATPQQISDYKANLIAGGMGGDLDQRQYLQEKSSGITTDDYATWKAKHVAAATAMTTQAKDVQEFKDSGKQDFSIADQKLTKSESTVDALLKDIDSTKKALSDPDFMTTGKFAANAPAWLTADPKVKAAAANVRTLVNELSASGLTGVKNVRNVREFNAIAGALTSALDPNNPDLGGALRDIKTKFETAHAQALAAAGKPIPYAYKDVVDPTYLDKSSPYYTGSALEDPPKDAPNAPRIKNYNPKTGDFE